MDFYSLEPKIPSLTDLIRRIGHRYLTNPLDVEDLIQDVLIKLLIAMKNQTLRFTCLRLWISVTAKRTALDALRQLRRRRTYMDDKISLYQVAWDECKPPDLGVRLDDHAIDSRKHLAMVLSHLPAEQRIVLFLHAYGWSYSEIAEITKLSIGTVRSRLHYARTKVHSLMHPAGNNKGEVS